jgi:hypothetical protein
MNTKKCKYCNEIYPLDFFEIANIIKGKEYRRHKCKNCYHETKNKRRQKISSQVQDYKKTLECSICGLKDYRVLDFHHENDKEFNIAAPEGRSFKNILEEIQKCSAICANCHRILHYEERLNRGHSKK